MWLPGCCALRPQEGPDAAQVHTTALRSPAKTRGQRLSSSRGPGHTSCGCPVSISCISLGSWALSSPWSSEVAPCASVPCSGGAVFGDEQPISPHHGPHSPAAAHRLWTLKWPLLSQLQGVPNTAGMATQPCTHGPLASLWASQPTCPGHCCWTSTRQYYLSLHDAVTRWR